MRLAATALVLIALPAAALAQGARAASDAVLDALMLDRLLAVMEQEAMETGVEIAEDMLPSADMASWQAQLARINDPERLAGIIRDVFAGAVPEQDVPAMLDFLTSPQGETIVGLEISAREALLDPEIDALSEEMLEAHRADDDPRLALIQRFVEANDLIDGNVLGAMNANAAFLQGMAAGAAQQPDDAEIAAQVVAQEPEIRADTIDWVYSFLLLAYQPLSDADLEAYIAFSQTGPGQTLNDALFAAFDRIFVLTSRETGEALARLLAAQEI